LKVKQDEYSVKVAVAEDKRQRDEKVADAAAAAEVALQASAAKQRTSMTPEARAAYDGAIAGEGSINDALAAASDVEGVEKNRINLAAAEVDQMQPGKGAPDAAGSVPLEDISTNTAATTAAVARSEKTKDRGLLRAKQAERVVDDILVEIRALRATIKPNGPPEDAKGANAEIQALKIKRAAYEKIITDYYDDPEQSSTPAAPSETDNGQESVSAFFKRNSP